MFSFKMLQDRQNRFEEDFDYKSNMLGRYVIWTSILCGIITIVQSILDYKEAGTGGSFSIPLIGSLLLFFAPIAYLKFPKFKYKNLILTMIMFTYLIFRSVSYQMPLPPSTLWILLFPIFAAFTISSFMHKVYFTLSIISIVAIYFYFSVESIHPFVEVASHHDKKALLNILAFSVIFYSFVRLVIKNEEHSYELLEHKLTDNGHTCFEVTLSRTVTNNSLAA
jgi:hypothetical protein